MAFVSNLQSAKLAPLPANPEQDYRIFGDSSKGDVILSENLNLCKPVQFFFESHTKHLVVDVKTKLAAAVSSELAGVSPKLTHFYLADAGVQAQLGASPQLPQQAPHEQLRYEMIDSTRPLKMPRIAETPPQSAFSEEDETMQFESSPLLKELSEAMASEKRLTAERTAQREEKLQQALADQRRAAFTAKQQALLEQQQKIAQDLAALQASPPQESKLPHDQSHQQQPDKSELQQKHEDLNKPNHG